MPTGTSFKFDSGPLGSVIWLECSACHEWAVCIQTPVLPVAARAFIRSYLRERGGELPMGTRVTCAACVRKETDAAQDEVPEL